MFCTHIHWLMNAIGFLGKIIPTSLESTRTASSAYHFKFTYTAFTLDFRQITQFIEKRRVTPYFSKAALPDVPRFYIEISASLYTAHV